MAEKSSKSTDDLIKMLILTQKMAEKSPKSIDDLIKNAHFDIENDRKVV